MDGAVLAKVLGRLELGLGEGKGEAGAEEEISPEDSEVIYVIQ